MSKGLYRTVLRKTGGPIKWLAIRMCGDVEMFRALGKNRDVARENLKIYEMERRCDMTSQGLKVDTMSKSKAH